MTQTSRTATHRWITALAIMLSVYVGAYLLSTEIFRGQLGGTRYRIRLFQSVWHQRVFSPLLSAEQRLRPVTPEFSGQVRSGASLPSPES